MSENRELLKEQREEEEKESEMDLVPEEIKPLLKKLPDEEQKTVSEIIEYSIKKSWSGPLPPPDVVKAYDDVIVNGAERLFSKFEKQSDHRMELEKTAILTQLKQSGRGQNYGFIIALCFLAASVFLAYTGHEVMGTIIGSLDLVALVSIFVFGKYEQSKNLRNKK